MATATIPRQKLSRLPFASEELKQLARDAQMILGYEALADKFIWGQESLREALRRIDIQPLKWEAVMTYRREQKARIEKEIEGYHYWREVGIAKFEGEIPPFVLRKAIEIRRACPEVKLFVESLDNDPDPFLIAKLGKEEYYIEVWDEKEFERMI